MAQDQYVQIGQAFVKHYYDQPISMCTFEGEPILGTEAIIRKLVSLKFQTVQHILKTVDCQPSGAAGGIIVFVNGDLKVDGSENPIKFSQSFHLLPQKENPANYWVHNDLFRLNYG